MTRQIKLQKFENTPIKARQGNLYTAVIDLLTVDSKIEKQKQAILKTWESNKPDYDKLEQQIMEVLTA